MLVYTSQNHTVEFNQFLLQFQSDSRDTWQTCNAGVVDVRDAIFYVGQFVCCGFMALGLCENRLKLI